MNDQDAKRAEDATVVPADRIEKAILLIRG